VMPPSEWRAAAGKQVGPLECNISNCWRRVEADGAALTRLLTFVHARLSKETHMRRLANFTPALRPEPIGALRKRPVFNWQWV
jgi:hypothetical protein